jgi:hypothetical protein
VSDFQGKTGFIWWVGIVENRMDPLGLGRCQVRAFGWHDDGNPQTKIKMRVEDLPWATPLLPCNAAKTFSVPELGDWVVGFFLDGEAAQMPIMMGVIPGFTPSKADLTSFNNVTTI